MVKKEIKLAKMKVKGKVEDGLRSGNSHNACRGIKSMVGMQDKKREPFNPDKPDFILADESNQFYVRFDTHNHSDKLAEFRVA